jgi:hypothetical protein
MVSTKGGGLSQPSSSPLSGFRSEADMLAPIAASARLFLSRHRRQRGFDVFYELPVGHGIADVVIVQFDHDILNRRYEAGVGPVEDYLAVQALLALQHAPSSTTSELAGALRISVDHLRRAILPRLAEIGWITRAGTRSWALRIPFQSLARGILAIEAKRRAWQSAASQARRYLRFANQVFVVLDAATLPARAADAQASPTGIGMATVEAGSTRVQLLRAPPWRRPLSQAEFALCAERAWMLAMRGQRSGPLEPVFGVQRLATAAPDPRLPSAEAGCCQ